MTFSKQAQIVGIKYNLDVKSIKPKYSATPTLWTRMVIFWYKFMSISLDWIFISWWPNFVMLCIVHVYRRIRSGLKWLKEIQFSLILKQNSTLFLEVENTWATVCPPLNYA